MGFTVSFVDDAAAFRGRAGEWLARDPVPSTVVSTVVDRAVATAGRGEDPGGDLPYWWFAVVDGPDGVVGAAMRTAPFRPYPAYVLAMPDAAAVALAEAMLARGEPIGGVAGARPAADRCAEVLAAEAGQSVEVVLHTRLFELDELVDPVPVPGRLRAVRSEEAGLALAWIRAFFRDADEQAGRVPGSGHDGDRFAVADVERRIAEGVLWFWVDEHDTPVHLTGANPPAYGAARVGPVYTPAEHRGRGYASAAVAQVSRRLRDAGSRPILFTDQANPTSNRIYVALGYRPVVDTVELALESR